MRGHPGVPDGLAAYAQPTRADGSFSLDKSDRPKVRRVRMRAEPPVDSPVRPDGLLMDADWHWATSAPRRWQTIASRFADHAGSVSLALARAGCIALDHDYRLGKISDTPRGWTPHPWLAGLQATERASRRSHQDELAVRAEALREQLAAEWPGAAAALTVPASDPRLAWLIWAGEDLATGRSHDGVRAFVQVHAGDTKARDDVPRLPADRPISLDVIPGTHTLLVIENRQAAEAICDHHPETAVIWCHGQPPHSVLELINQVSAQVDRVVICPDADLGGIRIAARVHDQLPAGTRSDVLDIGSVEHIAGHPFSPGTCDLIGRLAQRDDAVGDLARGCLRRGYGIEQEAPVRAALRELRL